MLLINGTINVKSNILIYSLKVERDLVLPEGGLLGPHWRILKGNKYNAPGISFGRYGASFMCIKGTTLKAPLIIAGTSEHIYGSSRILGLALKEQCNFINKLAEQGMV